MPLQRLHRRGMGDDGGFAGLPSWVWVVGGIFIVSELLWLIDPKNPDRRRK